LVGNYNLGGATTTQKGGNDKKNCKGHEGYNRVSNKPI
jgi:hypothetical protein